MALMGSREVPSVVIVPRTCIGSDGREREKMIASLPMLDVL